MVGGRGVTLPTVADGEDLVLALRLHESGRQQRSQVVLTADLTMQDLEVIAAGSLQSVVEAQLDELTANPAVLRWMTHAQHQLELREAEARQG